jgi:surfeit locus 1 family protein
MKQRPGWIFHGAALAAFACLLALGTWQVQRLEWKEGLIASIEARMKSPPLPLADIEKQFRETGDVDYVPVSLSGRLVPQNDKFFLSTHQGQSGWNIYTPLELPDQRIVMLNRGFVPYDYRDKGSATGQTSTAVLEITGLARNPLAAKPSSLTPENDPGKNIWYWKDLKAMASSAGVAQEKLLPFFVDDWTEQAAGALPTTRTTIVSLPNNHLQYAITWYGLAAALAGVWVLMTFRRSPISRPA